MTAVIATSPRFKFFDNSGNPAAAYLLYTYAAGTTTPATTWQDQGQATANTNPIELDANGECLLWLTSGQEYKFVLKTAAGATIRTTDDISGPDISGIAGVLRADLIASSGSSIVGYMPAGAGAVATTVQAKLRESISVSGFGVVGDGATDDTAMFTAFESGTTGIAVDMLGLTCLVTAIPTGNDYFNGAFKVGAATYPRNRTPREHPLANPVMHAKAILPAQGKYRGLSTAAFHEEGTSTIAVVYREALGHAPGNGYPIYCELTDDGGDRFNTGTSGDSVSRIIAQQSNADIRNWASGVMDSGRFGILAARYDNDLATYLDAMFLYSDDAGATWSDANVSFTSTTWDSHSRIYPYPASAGGHDTLGWIAYAYTTSNGICAMKTVNNGSTWTEVLDCVLPTSLDPASEAASLSEMSVARIGTENKWVMVVRTNQEAAVSTSTNMTTWTSAKLIQTTVQAKLLANPPELTYADGKFWFWSFSRRGSKEIYADYANALMVSEGNPAAVFASAGATGWKPWRVVSGLPFWPSGYMNHFSVRGRPYALCTTGEDTAGSSTSRRCVMTLLGPDPTVTMNPLSVWKQIPNVNLYPGGDFRHFPITSPIVSGASRVHFAPQMSFARGSGVAGGTITRLAGDKSKYKLRVRRDDGNTGTQTLNIVLPLTLDDSYQLRSQYVTISFRAAMASGFSAAAGFLTVRMRSTTSTAEGVVTSTSGTPPTGDTTVQSSSTGVTLNELWDDYNLVIGPFASDINQAFLQIFYTPVGTATDDYFEIEDLKIEKGKIPTPFVREPIQSVRNWADRFMTVFDFPLINGVQYRPHQAMHRTPTVTATVGTVTTAAKDYLTLTHSAAVSTTITAIAQM